MVKMTLADGTEIEFSGINGNNFIVPDQKEMDVSIFTDDSLKEGTVIVDDKTYEFESLRFTQQQKQKNGDYYICFHETTLEEKEADLEELLVQVASIEVEEGNLEIGSIPASLVNEVRMKVDDSKRLDR